MNISAYSNANCSISPNDYRSIELNLEAARAQREKRRRARIESPSAWLTAKPYEPRGGAYRAFYSQQTEILLDGPADTGKSRACLEKLYYCAHKYRGMRAAIVRKTRRSITQTAMITFENKVLPPSSPVHFHSGKQAYTFPNGSEIIVMGCDDPIKLQSGEYDVIYIQEATELTENDWEMISKLLRNGIMPYQQLIADCNPNAPSHWLNIRCNKGQTIRLLSRHADNPSITPERLARLQALTGVRRKRLYEGIWAAAENMVFEPYDPAIHLIDRFPIPSQWLTEAGVDFGFTNPGGIGVIAYDGDDRAFLIHEVYRVKQDFDLFWIPEFIRLQRLHNISTFWCDPSEPGYIAKMQAAGLNAVAADNDVALGLDCVRSRMAIAGDGRPRFQIFRDSLEERDPERDEAKQPCGFAEEVEGYVNRVDGQGNALEEPVKKNDHSMDYGRYALYSHDGPDAGYTVRDPRIVNVASLNPDSMSDLGSLSLGKNGYYSIIRLWLDSLTGKRYLVEAWRKPTHPADALANLARLHRKRPFEAIGIDSKLYESLESLIDESALPFQVIEDEADPSVAISSGLADGSLIIADHIVNSSAWPQLINLQSEDDDVRNAVAGASALCLQAF